MQTLDYTGPQSYTPLNVEGVEALLREIISNMAHAAAKVLCPNDQTTGEATPMEGRLCRVLAAHLAQEARVLSGP